MKISTKGRYALRMMVDLAVHSHGEWISLKEISERQNISIKISRADSIKSDALGPAAQQPRPAGGYMLARKPEDYTVGEILREIEGSLVPVACMESDPNHCLRYKQCPTIKFWEGLYKVVTDYVNSVTLADPCAAGKSRCDRLYDINIRKAEEQNVGHKKSFSELIGGTPVLELARLADKRSLKARIVAKL